jgi:hypothetical protein
MDSRPYMGRATTRVTLDHDVDDQTMGMARFASCDVTTCEEG